MVTNGIFGRNVVILPMTYNVTLQGNKGVTQGNSLDKSVTFVTLALPP